MLARSQACSTSFDNCLNQRYRLGSFFHEFTQLGFIQINLIHRGILVRGAITIGQVCHADGLIFGLGLADAYRLESKVAVVPRIMVSDELIGAHKTDPRLRRKSHTYGDEVEHLAGVLRQDHDGIWFLDYLEFMKSEADDNEQYGQFLLQHKRLI